MTRWRQELGRITTAGMLMLALMGCQHVGAQAPAASEAGGEGVTVMLSGKQQVPPVSSSAAGTAMVQVAPDRTVSGKVTYSGVNATAAHIHQGSKGATGRLSCRSPRCRIRPS